MNDDEFDGKLPSRPEGATRVAHSQVTAPLAVDHATSALCPECAALIAYARRRLEHCPYDPKPKCKKCPTHCYKPEMRARVREIMKFSGMHFVKRGRVDWLVRYFWGVGES